MGDRRLMGGSPVPSAGPGDPANPTDPSVDAEQTDTAATEDSGTRRGRQPLRLGPSALVGLLGFAVLLVLWQVIAVTGIIGARQVPTPWTVLESLISLFASGEGIRAVAASTQRVVLGVTIGVALATPIGFLLGWYPLVRGAVEPLVNFFRALPPIALIPLVIIYLGIGEVARVLVLTWAAFFISVVVIYEGIRSIDPVYIKAATVLGANSWEVFAKVVVPISVPTLLTAVRVALGTGWGTLVAAELIAAQSGLGSVISVAANYFNIPRVYAGILLIGLIALLMDRAVRFVLTRIASWQDVIA